MAPLLALAILLHRPVGASTQTHEVTSAISSPPRVVALERLEGALLLPFKLTMGGLDTTGLALLDTGAGFLAMDRGLAARLGHAPDTTGGLAMLPAPITGVGLGGPDTIHTFPAIALDLAGVRAATDRNVLALAGASLFREQALVIDPRLDELTLVRSPHVTDTSASLRIERSRVVLGEALTARSVAVPFELRADDKIVVRATLDHRVSLQLVLDTGATKLALFRTPLVRRGPWSPTGRRMQGARAPTVYGDAAVEFVRLGTLDLPDARPHCSETELDAALLDSPLAEALGRTIGGPVHGLLGDSFLRRFRYAIDYGARVLWLDRLDVGRDAREYEFCTIGIQLHRPAGATRVAGVVKNSPAHRAGLRIDDEILSVDGTTVHGTALLELTRALEGPPGSTLTLEWRRGTRVWQRTIRRERLL